MLEYVKIVNINSIGECVIDFTKDKYKYLEENVIDNFVNPIALYGHNGSGKTSFLRAISYLISLLTSPVDNLEPFIVNDFKFHKFVKDKNENNLIGSIELHFSFNNTYYEYYIAISRIKMIVREYLKTNKMIFDRTGNIETYNGKSNKINGLRSLLVPSIRYFASEEINDTNIQDAYKFITSFTFVDLPCQSSGMPFVISKHFNNVSRADLIVGKSEDVKNILKDYKEFPIYSVVKRENPLDPSKNGYFLKFDDIDGEISFNFASDGMLNQSTLLSILVSLPSESVLFIDEIEQALHPSALMSFLKVVKERKIQLVFSSHNTYILQSLRPDQVYFSKWKKGETSFHRLSRIYPNIREINNIEKMYLSSIFDEAIDNA